MMSIRDFCEDYAKEHQKAIEIMFTEVKKSQIILVFLIIMYALELIFYQNIIQDP